MFFVFKGSSEGETKEEGRKERIFTLMRQQSISAFSGFLPFVPATITTTNPPLL
jgi:hypothetical protein